ncbi:MAG TPA: DUF192 domain-containing protein [Burkholderiaceae bacterium]|nr:DUF192 domain-containing protein [Burkholderiaceae bacterium]
MMKRVSMFCDAADGASTLAADVLVANRYFSRLRGLIGHPPLQPGRGLWIVPTQQVHTHFMGAPIDVIFLDRDMKVLRVVPALAPWKLSPWVKGARSALELAAGTAATVAVGDRLVARPCGHE